MEISDELQLSMNKAFQLAAKSRHEFVTPEHLLVAFFEYDTMRDLFDTLSIPVIPFIHEVESFLNAVMPTGDGTEAPLESLGFRELLTESFRGGESVPGTVVGVSDVLSAMLTQKESYAAYFLISHGVTEKRMAEALRFLDMEAEDNFRGMPYFGDGEDDDDEEEDSDEGSGGRERLSGKNPVARLTVDLTEAAAAGELPPFAGREDLLETIQLVLLRKQKHNPLLVGDPGVGKTALAEGLARLIASGRVPSFLRGRRLLMPSVSGGRYRGEFEMRMRRLLSALENDHRVILFIDDIHLLMGDGEGNRSDAAYMLKTALTAGRLICIGATTFEDYKKRLEPEKAFIRCFQVIEVPEPKPEETAAIIAKVKPGLESYHRVSIPAKTARYAVELAGRYLKDRRQPDKTIDLLDVAGADAAYRAFRQGSVGKPTVTNDDLTRIAAKMAGIRQEKLNESEEEKLRSLEQTLKETVYGQDEAVEAVTAAVKRSYAGLRRENLPVASMLFIGPTGVGKTELAKQLAQALGIGFIRFDMSEYQEKSSVARFIGAPPGYIGYQEGGVLIDAVRRQPYAVLLLDEIEKAHQEVFNLLLQVMDNASLTDSLGRKADFEHIVLIMTGNVGAADWERGSIGFGGGFGEKAGQALKETFTPEFRNRLDAVIRFRKLTETEIRRVVNREIGFFTQQLKKKSVTLSLSAEAVDYLVRKGSGKEGGARPAARAVETELKALFADEILFGSLKTGGKVRVGSDGRSLYIEKQRRRKAPAVYAEEKKNDKRRKSEGAL